MCLTAYADVVRVEDSDGRLLFWTHAKLARKHVVEGRAHSTRRSKCVRTLTWRGSPPSVITPELGWPEVRNAIELSKAGSTAPILPGKKPEYFKSSGFRATRYSHDHEVSDTYTDEHGVEHERDPMDPNPANVWTLKRLPNFTEIVFLAVARDCGARMILRKTRLTCPRAA